MNPRFPFMFECMLHGMTLKNMIRFLQVRPIPGLWRGAYALRQNVLVDNCQSSTSHPLSITCSQGLTIWRDTMDKEHAQKICMYFYSPLACLCQLMDTKLIS